MNARTGQIALAGAIGVALVGFFMGTHEGGYAENAAPANSADQTPTEGVRSALSAFEQRLSPRGHGSGWTEDLAALGGPSRLDPVELSGTKAAALADRAALRAYDGAPPAIPHAVRQGSAPECLACHEDGVTIRGRTAPAMSHELHSSCTQCHVVSEGPVPGEVESDPRDVPNSFVGLASASAGLRAWEIGPPQVPHTSFMRENCLSCHGPNGDSAMKSTHPSRESCTQCHTPGAEQELRPYLGGGLE